MGGGVFARGGAWVYARPPSCPVVGSLHGPFARPPPLYPPAAPHSAPASSTVDDPLWVGANGVRYQALACALGRTLRQHMLNVNDLEAAEGEDNESDDELLEEPTRGALQRAIAAAPAGSPMHRAFEALPPRDREAVATLLRGDEE